jgi:hypothetical protein
MNVRIICHLPKLSTPLNLIIHVVGRSTHEGARPRKGAGNARTMSSRQAYDSMFNHRTVSKHRKFYLVTSGRTSKRRNRCARTRYNSQYAKLSGEITKHAQKTKKTAYFMPRQLRGPFEKLTNQLSNAWESGWSHRSGRKSYGRTKISSEKLTKRELWLTTVCLILRSIQAESREIRGTPTPPGIRTPEITAPDGGTTRGGPAGVDTERRSVSLITAVCPKTQDMP